MNGNEQLYFNDYLLEATGLSAEDERLKRKQAMVDYLRQASLDAPQAQQAGRVVVAPSWTQVLGQVGQAYAANRGQKKVDEGVSGQNNAYAAALRRLRGKLAPQPISARPDEEDIVEGFGASGGNY